MMANHDESFFGVEMGRIAKTWMLGSLAKYGVLIGFAVFSLSTVAQGTNATEVMAMMKKLDANKDGLVSKQEAAKMPAIASVFDRADVNRDGNLDANEFTAAIAMSAK
jgi:Ca2+-binding EF-hand superfamily protein